MGYDLHITRAEFWPNSEGYPITEAEWHSLASKVDDLDVIASTYVLRFPEGVETLMWWRDGQITINKPFGRDRAENEMITDALADLAARVSARLTGDDGEMYERRATA